MKNRLLLTSLLTLATLFSSPLVALPNGGVETGSITEVDQENTHTFSMSVGESFTLTIGGEINQVMRVYEPDGNLLCNTAYFCGEATVDQGGTYTVIVALANNSNTLGSYELHFAKMPGANEHGSLSSGGLNFEEITDGDTDSYTFDADAGDSVNISVAGDLILSMRTYLPDGSPTTCTSTDCTFNSLTQSGTYTVIVRSTTGGNTGTYQIHYVKSPGSVEHGSLSNGGREIGSLTARDIDSYSFSANAGESAQLAIDADLRPNIRIYSPNGDLICNSNSDCNENNLPLTGTYNVVLKRGSGSPVNFYELHFAKAPGANEHGNLGSGGIVTEVITAGDVDSYTFNANTGDTAYFDIDGSNLTPKMWFYAPDGTYLDDSRNTQNFNSLPQDGLYTLIVTKDGSGYAGPYQIAYSISGSEQSEGTGTQSSTPQKEDTFCTKDEPCACAANPIQFAQGFKAQSEMDYASGALVFERIYRSDSDWTNSTLGMYWRHNYFRDLSIFLNSSNVTTAELIDGRGALITFNQSGSSWVLADPDYQAKFETTFSAGLASGYLYTDENDTKEYFDLSGQLIRIEYLSGEQLDFTYDTSSRLETIADKGGYTLTLSYDANGRVSTLDTPNGLFTYSYDANDNLTSVLKPDTNTRTYHYEDTNFINALTGITDEKGNRYATWGYDSQGRATSSQHAGGVDSHTITYNADDTVTVTNPLGKQATYHFSTIQGLRKIEQIEGIASTNCAAANEFTSYDANGFIDSTTDREGNITNYVRNTRGLVTSMTEAVGTSEARVTTYTYDPTYRLPDIVTEPGRTTDYDYDIHGRITSITVTDTATNDARTVTYSYHPSTTDGNGNTVLGKLHQIDGARTDVTDVITYLYDANFNVSKITNTLNQESNYTSYDSAGRLLGMTDSNGVSSSFSYDTLGRMTSQTTGSRTTTYAYDAAGLLETLTLPDGREYTYSYDDAQRLTSIESKTGERTEYILDNAGNRLEEIMRDPNGTITNRYRKEFDELSRLMATVETINSPDDARTEFDYDLNDQLTTLTDPYAETSVYAYDALLRQTSLTDAKTGVTSSGYNALDQLTSVTAANSAQTTFTNNAFGEVAQEVSPDRGTTTYTYDSAGNMLTRTDARGIVATYAYDALNRLSSITYPDTSENVTYIYDSNPTGAITCTNGIGRLCRIEDESGITHFAYDEYGNIVDRVHVELGISYSHSFTFDDGDQLTQLTTSENRAINYTRDTERRISEVTTMLNSLSTTLATNIQYQPDGSEINVDFGNGLSEGRAYDENGLLTSETTGQAAVQENVPLPFWMLATIGILLSSIGYLYIGKKQNLASSILVPMLLIGLVAPDIALANQGITYDLNKNIVSRQVDSGTTTYQYDELNRLTNESGNAATQGFTYDANHNRLTDGGGSYSYTANSNQMSAQHGNSITYDLAGNMTDNGQGLTFEYNNAGRLKRVYDNAVLVATYTYNAFGQRTRKVTPTETTVYHYDLNGQLIEETLGDGTPQTTYTWRDNKPTSVISKAETPSNSSTQDKVVYLHNDHLNTPRSATDDTQTIVWSWESDAFGSTSANTDPDGNGEDVFVNLRFPGQYFDAESGLHYNWSRYYDPNLGRYITSDPIGLAGGSNTFGYAAQNSLSFTDSQGLALDTITDALFIAYDFGKISYGKLTCNSDLVREGQIDLAADSVAFFVPFAPAGSTRIARHGGSFIDKVKNLIKPYRNKNGGTETVQRAMSHAELANIQNSGFLSRTKPDGSVLSGDHFVSNAVNSSSNRARQRLALPGSPEVRVTLDVPKGVFSQPTRVDPRFNMPGGGYERIAPGHIDIPVTIRRIDDL